MRSPAKSVEQFSQAVRHYTGEIISASSPSRAELPPWRSPVPETHAWEPLLPSVKSYIGTPEKVRSLAAQLFFSDRVPVNCLIKAMDDCCNL